MMSELDRIRDAEKRSHLEVYSTTELFSPGSWLARPVKTVMDLLPLLEDYPELRVLDLGCGVGRNSIPIAQKFRNIPCRVDCVDILEYAVEKLGENARKYQLEDLIFGYESSIEDFKIGNAGYDLILAISALEHVASRTAFIRMLSEIQRGTRAKGIVCLVVNTEVREENPNTGEELPPQFEVNLPTEEMMDLLRQTFSGWEVLKQTVVPQQYEIPRDVGTARLTTNVVTYAARKHDGSEIL